MWRSFALASLIEITTAYDILYDVENDAYGVWELTPVSLSDNDFTTSTGTKAIANQNGTTSQKESMFQQYFITSITLKKTKI